ncbi:Small-conductance mechanosensitive channel [Rubripirellula lacrimiformis]|uniref:Small-conductance mechanosensitive channel n=1 Tax=Rubripirellula lacrimiformis TaxID=1930273 RepID=A0A517N7F4_9BACT|nr:mechanosensitive ion channel domain-containing protein [Rubripirellula lacrimiformis]QDT03076.1 Small-conductance mechanosensitive channel [Rubripirellula lacrimiformis]
MQNESSEAIDTQQATAMATNTVADGANVVGAANDVAKDAATAAANQSGKSSSKASDEAVQLINDWQDISLLQIAVIVVGVLVTIAIIRRLLPFLAERGPSQLRLYLLAAVPIIRLLLMTLAVVWIIPIVFNVTFQNFLVIAGGASVAIGFAFKDYVSSLIAGLVAVFERPYRPGDWVRIHGDYGEVQSVGLRAITIRTPADDIVTVPHLYMWQNNVSNSNDGARTLMCIADFYVHPDHDAAALRGALRDVVMTSAYLEYDKPVLVVMSEEPWGSHYKVKAYPFDMRDQFMFITDLSVRGKEAIAEIGATEVTSPYTAIEKTDSPPSMTF